MIPCTVVIGKESVGKSQLIASLTGRAAYSANFRGSTVACETYATESRTFIDTPGILFQSDSATTRRTLDRLHTSDTVLLVASATHLDGDLADLLPLAREKHGAVVVTFWDKVQSSERTAQAISRLSQASGLPFIPLDARSVREAERAQILGALGQAQPFPQEALRERAGWCIEPRPTVLEHKYLGPLLALLFLLLPAIAAVWSANTFAEKADPIVQAAVVPLVEYLKHLPTVFQSLFVGRYGLVTMGPLLFVWAVPTVILYALFLGAYKASGLLDRISVSLHPLLHPFGLSGRDLVRVLMGFGCNVPAVISTRACSSCSRGTCISAIAFGSACSYQFGATLGVFGAAGLPLLVIPYLLFLTTTTLLYARFTAPPEARSPANTLIIEGHAFFAWPRWPAIWREARGTLRQFFRQAIPIFFVITFIASLLDWIGVLSTLTSVLNPLMALFHLPAEAALPVVLTSIRKDGILLFAESHVLTTLTPLQILTGVYLAGVLLPCLVTALTIAREQSWQFALRLMIRQGIYAVGFSMILAWGGLLLSH